jgi:hypothetical protein
VKEVNRIYIPGGIADQPKQAKTPENTLFSGVLEMVEVTGFEPATFWSRSIFSKA